MKNSVDVHVEFSFQGKDYSLCSTIDLDKFLAQHASLPSLHAILAKEHGIDTYSYLYEVMQDADLEFSNARGNANGFVVDGEFDLATLESNWQNLRILAQLRPIANSTLGITDLDQHEALKSALIQAYRLGCEQLK